MIFLLGMSIFMGYVRFREGTPTPLKMKMARLSDLKFTEICTAFCGSILVWLGMAGYGWSNEGSGASVKAMKTSRYI